jgi:hypothetical protein
MKILNYASWLAESFADAHPKQIFVDIPQSELLDYADEIVDLINKAYAGKGGNVEFKKGSDLKGSDVTYWIAKDVDTDPDADVVLGGKPTPHGVKMTVMGQDGGTQAKKDAVLKMIELMKTRGFYAEVDPDLAQKFGLTHIKDEKEIRKVLNKDIKMNPDGSYDRKLTGGPMKTKVLIGIPK